MNTNILESLEYAKELQMSIAIDYRSKEQKEFVFAVNDIISMIDIPELEFINSKVWLSLVDINLTVKSYDGVPKLLSYLNSVPDWTFIRESKNPENKTITYYYKFKPGNISIYLSMGKCTLIEKERVMKEIIVYEMQCE